MICQKCNTEIVNISNGNLVDSICECGINCCNGLDPVIINRARDKLREMCRCNK
jgi:hypothetical protein